MKNIIYTLLILFINQPVNAEPIKGHVELNQLGVCGCQLGIGNRIIKTYPATDPNLRIMDKVLIVNDQPASRMTSECRRSIGSEIKITIERNEEIINLTIKTIDPELVKDYNPYYHQCAEENK